MFSSQNAGGAVMALLGLVAALTPETAHAVDHLVPGDFSTIQAAINAAAADGDRVLISDGTFTGANNVSLLVQNKSITIEATDGASGDVTIDCELAARGILVLDGILTMRHMRIINGRTTAAQVGGGIGASDSGAGLATFVELEHCTFENCAAVSGGAIYIDDQSATAQQVSLVARDCTFDSCASYTGFGGGGGAAHVFHTGGAFERCMFIGCQGDAGGALLINATTTAFSTSGAAVNCLFVDNSAPTGGAVAILSNGGAPAGFFAQCTVTGNAANQGDGFWSNSSIVVDNSILWGNSGGSSDGAENDQLFVTVGSGFIARHNVIEGLSAFAGLGNIGSDPLFLDAGAGDFRLPSDSPAVDAGDNTLLPPGTVIDFDGLNRLEDDPCAADAGVGPAPVVDIGAFERQGPIGCAGDANDDGAVDVDDLVVVILQWGTDGCPSFADVDGSGVVDVDDLVQLILNWGICP